jgi:UDP-N-acetylmuramoyl-L-alanyl-D-glutamate--2,6-diaminopimelate ligase
MSDNYKIVIFDLDETLGYFQELSFFINAIENVLKTINDIRTKNEQLITVVGCGGDRDPHKRIPMGENASRYADLVVVTDDNPRTEDASEIRAEVVKGTANANAEVVEIANRLEAIHFAVKNANPGDCLIVLGKGHETGQEVNGVVTPFDDRIVLAEAIRVRMT